MADVSECITKLVATGAISRAIGDEALEMFKRSRAEYSRTMGPSSADAAAALEAAKKLRDTAKDKQLAASVKTWRDIERRVVDDPRGGMLAVTALSSKDTLLGDKRLNALRTDNPEHPIFRAGSVDSNRQVIGRDLYNMLRPEIDKFKGRGGFANASKLIDEIFGVDTGNQAANAVAAGFGVLGGPAGGLAADIGRTALSPLRHELFDKQGRRATSGTASEVFKTLERWTPNTWFTKLAVDRLFWEELQSLIDPHYRDSFKRANQAAKKNSGQGYWFAPGTVVPGFMK